MIANLIAWTVLFVAVGIFGGTLESPFLAGFLGGRRYYDMFSDEKKLPIRIATIFVIALCGIIIKYPNILGTPPTYVNATVLYSQPDATNQAFCSLEVQYVLGGTTYQVQSPSSTAACNYTKGQLVSVQYQGKTDSHGIVRLTVPPQTTTTNPLGPIGSQVTNPDLNIP